MFGLPLYSSNVTAAAIRPDELSDLALWLDAETGVFTTVGNAVTAWNDQGPVGYGFINDDSPSKRPVLVANAFGSKPGISFAGKYLVPSGGPIPLLNGMTLFVALNTANLTSGVYDLFWGDNYSVVITSGGNVAFVTAAFSLEDNLGAPGMHTIAVTRGPSGAATLYLDGLEKVTEVNLYSAIEFNYIGTDGNSFGPVLAEVIVYEDAKSEEEIEQLHAYATARWF